MSAYSDRRNLYHVVPLAQGKRYTLPAGSVLASSHASALHIAKRTGRLHGLSVAVGKFRPTSRQVTSVGSFAVARTALTPSGMIGATKRVKSLKRQKRSAMPKKRSSSGSSKSRPAVSLSLSRFSGVRSMFGSKVGVKRHVQVPSSASAGKSRRRKSSVRGVSAHASGSGGRSYSVGGPVKVQAHTIHRDGKTVKVKAFTRKKGRRK